MTAPAAFAHPPSPIRAWFALVGLSLRRQARARQMVWVAGGLLALALAIIYSITLKSNWSSLTSRYVYPSPRLLSYNPASLKAPPGPPPRRVATTYAEVVQNLEVMSVLFPAPPALAVESAVASGLSMGLARSPVVNFTRGIMFSLFVGFLLPVWCLSFATEALGGEQEQKTMVWLLTRPLPRWSIYLAKFIALLPWALAFSLGGFWAMCQAAGPPADEVFWVFWPAIALGALAFSSLFHLFSAATRRPTVVGLVYCFFLETILGDMPGLMKRISVSFYVRCHIFESAAAYGIMPDKPNVYLPVSGATATTVLVVVTAVALVLGAVIFTVSEYRDSAA